MIYFLMFSLIGSLLYLILALYKRQNDLEDQLLELRMYENYKEEWRKKK